MNRQRGGKKEATQDSNFEFDCQHYELIFKALNYSVQPYMIDVVILANGMKLLIIS